MPNFRSQDLLKPNWSKVAVPLMESLLSAMTAPSCRCCGPTSPAGWTQDRPLVKACGRRREKKAKKEMKYGQRKFKKAMKTGGRTKIDWQHAEHTQTRNLAWNWNENKVDEMKTKSNFKSNDANGREELFEMNGRRLLQSAVLSSSAVLFLSLSLSDSWIIVKVEEEKGGVHVSGWNLCVCVCVFNWVQERE